MISTQSSVVEYEKNRETVGDHSIDRLDDKHFLCDLVFCPIDQCNYRLNVGSFDKIDRINN
jgi:hypothetical protein